MGTKLDHDRIGEPASQRQSGTKSEPIDVVFIEIVYTFLTMKNTASDS